MYAVAPQLPKVLNILILPLITAHLSAADYGVFALLVTYVGLVEGIKDLGFSLLVTNAYFKHPSRYKQVWQRIYGFNLIWAVALFLLMLPVVYYTIPVPDRVSSEFFVLAAAILTPPVIYSTINNFGICYFQYQEKPIPIAFVSLLTGLISVAGTYFFAVVMSYGYKSFIYSAFIATTVSFIFYQYVISAQIGIKIRFEFTYKWIVRSLKKTAPTIPHYYTNFILSMSDRLVLNLFSVPVSQIGVYGFAYNLANNYSILGKSVGKAAAPIYMRSYKSGNSKEILKITAILQLVFLALAVTFCIWMKEIFGFLAKNPELAEGYYLAIPVILANAVYPLYFASISLLRYKGITRVFWKITTGACLINVGLNLILVPFFGIDGAAMVTLLSYLYLGFSGFAIKEFRDLNNDDYHEMRWLAALVGTTFVAWFLRDSAVEEKALVTLAVAFLTVLLARKFRQLEL